MAEIDPIWIDWPRARIRRRFEADGGSITEFVVQLEYDIDAIPTEQSEPAWRAVARFDHDSTSEGGHDVTEEGLHLDVYRDGERYRRIRGFPRLSPGPAMRYCEEYLMANADRLLARFEGWHDIDHHRD